MPACWRGCYLIFDRLFYYKQVTQIATGETEKSEVVSHNLNLFLDKFVRFRDQLERVERFFAPKGQAGGGGFQTPRGGGNFGGGRGRGRGGRGGFSNDSFQQQDNRGNNNQYDNQGGSGNFERPSRAGGRGRGGASRGGRGSFSANSFQQQDRGSDGGFDRSSDQQNFHDGGNARGRGRGRGGFSNNNRGGRGEFLNNQHLDGQQQQPYSQRGGQGSYHGNQFNNRGASSAFRHGNQLNNSNRGGGGRGGNTSSAPIGQKRGGGSIPPTNVAAKRVHHSY